MSYIGSEPADIIEIRSAQDLTNLATTGVITVTSKTTFKFISTSNIITTVRFEVTDANLQFTDDHTQTQIIYAAGGTFITLTGDSDFKITGGQYNGATTGKFIDAVGNADNQIDLGDCDLLAWNELGDIEGHLLVVMRRIGIFVWGDGFNISVRAMQVSQSGSQNFADTGNTIFKFTSTFSDARFSIIDWISNLFSGESIARIDPSLDRTVLNELVQVSTGGTPLFDTSGADGTFTAVADASISATAITSVTDNSGVAQFNFTGPTVYVDQEVVVSGFATATSYNETGIVTATDGTSYFEFRVNSTTMVFDQTDTGSFLSDSVTLTDTATTLVDGDTITIDTDNSIDYDSGATVYNQLTNSIQINRTFIATETGTWSTRGIDGVDSRVTAINNPGFKDSQSIAFAHLGENIIVTTPAVVDVYQDVDLTGSTGAITVFATNGAGGTTVTSAANLLVENQNLVISGTTSYNGEFTIFNVGTNTFDINVTFVSDDATGTWDSILHLEDDTTERFKLIDPVAGEIMYTGQSDFSGFVNYIITSFKTGTAQDYLFSSALNSVIPEGQAYIRRTVTTSSSVSLLAVPAQLSYGDTIKLQVAGVGTTNIITIENLTVRIQ